MQVSTALEVQWSLIGREKEEKYATLAKHQLAHCWTWKERMLSFASKELHPQVENIRINPPTRSGIFNQSS